MKNDPLTTLAALATIATFLLEVWRTWKNRQSVPKREDDTSMDKKMEQ